MIDEKLLINFLKSKRKIAERLLVEPPQDKLDEIQNDIASGYITCCDEISEFISKTQEHITSNMEDKQIILTQLTSVLQQTDLCADLESLELTPSQEWVIIKWKHGSNYRANVSCDSGIQMIQDIVSRIRKK